MTVTYFPELEQGSEEWLAARCGIVTASVVGNLITSRYLSAIDLVDCIECGAIHGNPCVSKRNGAPIKTTHQSRTDEAAMQPVTVLDVSDNDTSRGVTATLAAERVTGHADATWVSADMFRGIVDEPEARDAYAKYREPVQEMGFVVHDGFDQRIGYSPDGLVGDFGLIEIKSRRQKNQLLTVIDEEIPHNHMAQMQCGLLVTGRKWCDYVSFAGGMALWVVRVVPDRKWFEAIRSAVTTFETNVADMIAKYNAAVEGFPMTERPIEIPEMVV